MELYSSYCKFILIWNNISWIIEPLLSRCKIIKFKKPNLSKSIFILKNYIIDNNIYENLLNKYGNVSDLLKIIITNNNYNLNKCIWNLKFLNNNKNFFSIDVILSCLIYNIYKNFDILIIFREYLYNCYILNIWYDEIFNIIYYFFIKYINYDIFDNIDKLNYIYYVMKILNKNYNNIWKNKKYVYIIENIFIIILEKYNKLLNTKKLLNLKK